ncbi:MAG: NUDIX domain-containing protein [Candidatus Nomurabacteria bacterium]|jgi:ADP-ribose pyrophosphatase YjhB (NUDIX family)|nr:NUDIX domain-containing protein [Candidatus Nomurabacteria bacterium]
MPHIHTQPGDHDATVSAFIVRIGDNQNPKILLHRHKKLNKLMQIGGHVETNENPWQAIIHEIREESGYELRQLKILQSAPNLEQNPNSNAIYLPIPVLVNSHQFGEENHFHDDLSFAFLTTELPNGEPDEGETRDFHWVDLTELNTLGSDDIVKNTQEISQYVLENFENWRAERVDKFGDKNGRL